MTEPKLDPATTIFGNALEADMQLDELRQFLAVVDHFLVDVELRHVEYKDVHGDDFAHMLSESFPSILYSSVITSTVTFVERESRCYAEALKRASGVSLSLRDLSGSWLDRFVKYCERVVGIDLEIEDDLWQDMKGLVEIRNCLVHEQGYLPDFQKREAVKAFFRRHRTLFPPEDFLDPDKQLTELILRIIKKFVDTIYRAASARYPRET